MMFKKFIALAVVATMVAGSSLTAFAADEGVTGTGAIEYDDSEDVVYDQIQVPTLSADTYAFKLDPNGLIAEFKLTEDDLGLEDGSHLYFRGTATKAKITSVATDKKFYKEKKSVVTADGTQGYKDLVTATIDNTSHKVTSYTVSPDYYLWVPDAEYTSGAGLSGKYIDVTADNIEDYFVIDSVDASGWKVKVTFRDDCKAGENICNGKLYVKDWDEIADGTAAFVLTDADQDPLSDYVTVDAEGEITAITGIFKLDAQSKKVAVEPADFTYTAAVVKYQKTTDTVYITNKSTKAKTVTAKVTLKNADGLTISNAENLGSDTTKAAVYVAAYSNSTATPLAKSGDVVSATITTNLAAATDNATLGGVTKFQSTELNKFGGHSYKKYAGPDPKYTSNTFKIVATATGGSGAADAWKTYFEALDPEKVPALNVVYSVKNQTGSETAYATVQKFGNTPVLLVKPSENSIFTNVAAVTDITSFELKLNSGSYVDVKGNAMVYEGMIGITYTDAVAKIGAMNSGDKVTAKVVVDGTTYEAVYKVQ